MTVPITKFENNDEASHAILEYLKVSDPSLKDKFSLRPYNRFLTAFTEWWFIPRGASWPAYRNGKLFVHKFQSPNEDDMWLYTGFFVEKGLGKELLGLSDVKKNLIMRSDWYWYKFLQHARNGNLDLPIKQVIENSQCPVWIFMDAYEFNKVPEPDQERQPYYDAIEFAIHPSESEFQVTREGKEIFAQLNECLNMREFAQQLNELGDDPYFWIDLVIGTRVQYGHEATGKWGATEIWHNALEPWSIWVE